MEDWAAEAVHRMADSGILQGRSDGTFGPRDFLTRAETAAAAERIKYRELMAELGERN
ncbi:MAG: S-layer homology domain-containing protein [Anaerovoracaceae bacterium]